jgi:hypothetical protein
MKSKKQILINNFDEVKQMIGNNRPLREISKFLGVKVLTLKRWLNDFGINYNGNKSRKGIPHVEQRISVYAYLGTDKSIESKTLKKKLIEEGLKERKCECCGNYLWVGVPIPLELHHKDGNHYNNNLDNLEILCSNCHSLKHNYSQE